MDSRYTVEPRFRYTYVHVLISGAGFFDFQHGQSGVAPNAVELHPVLDVVFAEQALEAERPVREAAEADVARLRKLLDRAEQDLRP
jgi:hypothetical protein